MKTYFHEKPIRNFTGILKLDKRDRSFGIEEHCKYKNRIIKLMKYPRGDKKYTSILSPDNISKLWVNMDPDNPIKKWILHLTESFDGGTVFEFKLNSEKLPN